MHVSSGICRTIQAVLAGGLTKSLLLCHQVSDEERSTLQRLKQLQCELRNGVDLGNEGNGKMPCSGQGQGLGGQQTTQDADRAAGPGWPANSVRL